MERRRDLWLPLPLFAILFYFSEGLPFGVVNELFPLYLREKGVSLHDIGLLSIPALAWTLKFFWSPLVDRYGSYRRWIAGALGGITISIAFFALTGSTSGAFFWSAVTLLAVGSATQDIAVDAYTIRATPRKDLGWVNSIRITAYRVAIIAAGGGMAALASFTSWRTSFRVAAMVAAAILFCTLTLVPPDRGEASQRSLVRGLADWLTRPNAAILLALVLLFRIGDSALAPMIKPFWVDRGYSAAEIGTVTTVIGVTFTILGGIAGGWVVTRIGIYRSLLWLGIVQMLSNGGYALVAMTGAGRIPIYSAAIVENFTGGLGIAAFLAFLMAICDRRYAATEYALLSALFGLTRSIAGAISGYSAEALGYADYFWLTVLLGAVPLLLLPVARRAIELATADTGTDAFVEVE
ncbi:MAG: MFS transporter [Thermoanaerobaculia bacterium]